MCKVVQHGEEVPLLGTVVTMHRRSHVGFPGKAYGILGEGRNDKSSRRETRPSACS